MEISNKQKNLVDDDSNNEIQIRKHLKIFLIIERKD